MTKAGPTDWKQSLQGIRVSPEEILMARENRVDRRRLTQHVFSYPLISFSLNIAGSVKQFPLAAAAFHEGDRRICGLLQHRNTPLLHREIITDPLGMVACYIVDADALQLKRWMAELENESEFTRLMDIDVYTPEGEQLSRSSIGEPPRRCFLCRQEARICAGRGVHSTAELQAHTVRVMREFFQVRFCDSLCGLVQRALLYEVSVTPKPGLVDRANCGAHRDMDYFTFLDSILALTPYFRRIMQRAMAFSGPPEALLAHVRPIGMEAEQVMLEATGGANTHKGAFFSLSLLCGAAGYAFHDGTAPDVPVLCALCSEICTGTLLQELEQPNGTSRGQVQFRRHGLTGARGEAASGFESARSWGVTSLRRAHEWGWDQNDAGVYALLQLMAHVNDSNIIGRTDLPTQQALQQSIQSWLKPAPGRAALLQYARELDAQLCSRNISPGGCADLLAVSYWLCSYEDMLQAHRTKLQEGLRCTLTGNSLTSKNTGD